MVSAADGPDPDWHNDDAETLTFGSNTGYPTAQPTGGDLVGYLDGWYRPAQPTGLPWPQAAPVESLLGEVDRSNGTSEPVWLDLLATVRYEPYVAAHTWVDRYLWGENTPRELTHPVDLADATDDLWPAPPGGRDCPGWLLAAALGGAVPGAGAAAAAPPTPTEWVVPHSGEPIGPPGWGRLAARAARGAGVEYPPPRVARSRRPRRGEPPLRPTRRTDRSGWWWDRWSRTEHPAQPGRVTEWAGPIESHLGRSSLDRQHHLRVWALTEVYTGVYGGRRPAW